MASSTDGIDISPSITRITTASSQRMKPVTSPIASPTSGRQHRDREADGERHARAVDHAAVDVAARACRCRTSTPPTAASAAGSATAPADRSCRARARRSRSASSAAARCAAGDRGRMPAQRVLEAAARSARPTSAATAAVRRRAISVPDPRIEQRVAQVDQQVDQHVDRREQQDHALDDRIVAPQDRIDRQPADAGNARTRSR